MYAINEVIVHATGKYQRYIHGGFKEVVLLTDPIFFSKITLTAEIYRILIRYNLIGQSYKLNSI